MNPRTVPFELPGLEVSVDRVVYRHLQGHERPHSFVYFISIRNRSTVSVVLRQRKWVVTHDDGTQIVVVGDGIVGQTPSIQAGGTFSYNSQHLIATQSAVAEGAYAGVDESGRAIVTRIPRFELRVPHPDL